LKPKTISSLNEDDALPFEYIKISTNPTYRSDTSGAGTDFDEWTNMKQRKVSEIPSVKLGHQ
jgi:hypothetical protein